MRKISRSRGPTPEKICVSYLYISQDPTLLSQRTLTFEDERTPPKKRIANDKVKIYVRMRPLLNVEEWNSNLMICDVNLWHNSETKIVQDNSIRITKADLDTTYMKFHRIFNAKYSQQDIFHSLEGSIQRFLEGENHSFFAQ